MSETNKTEYLPESPFPGISPFSFAHKGLFFARKSETRTLIRLIVMYRGILLYSDSGAGKSSLINAGIIPLAIDEGFQVERIRVQPKKDEEIVVERLSEQGTGNPPFLPSIFAQRTQMEHAVLPVEEFERELRQLPPTVRPLLVFDQFEEWVTLFESEISKEVKAAQEKIGDMISSLINDRELPVKVLIVLREDYLAQLEPLIEKCPSLPDHYLRLTSLSGDQITEVIRGPFKKYPARYQPEISESLTKKIQTQFEEKSNGADIHLAEVQIVCQNLFQVGKQGTELEKYFADKGVMGILEEYLEGTLESLKKDQQDPAIGLLTRMVTPAGTRKIIAQDDLLDLKTDKDNITTELLKKTLVSLEQEAKLVRHERRRDVDYYEIASEFLAGWIQKKAQERKHQVELEKLEKELEEKRQKERHRLEVKAERERAEQAELLAEVEARSARLFRRLAAALAVALIVAAASAGFGIYYYAAEKDTSHRLQKSLAAQTDLTDQLGRALAAQTELTKKAEALTTKLNEILTSGIEELKEKRDTREIAERWEKQLKGTIKPPPARTITPVELRGNVEDLRKLIEAHNEVLKKLSVGVLLNDQQMGKTAENFEQLYDKLALLDPLEPFFDDTTPVGNDFKELRERIQKLQDIRSQNEPERLVETAMTAEYTEAVYAAWIRLGELPASPWPNEKNDLDRDRKIRDCLKSAFEAVGRRDEVRGNDLLQELARTATERLIIFIKRNNSIQDKLLSEFCKFDVDEIARATPNGLESVEKLARDLADFMSSSEWPEKFRMGLMAQENPLYQKTDLTIADFEKWLSDVNGYRVLESDPRQQYLQDQIIQEIRKNIEKVRTNQPDKAREFQQRLNADKERIDELFEKPAIVKNLTEINNAASELKGISERLASLKMDVEQMRSPKKPSQDEDPRRDAIYRIVLLPFILDPSTERLVRDDPRLSDIYRIVLRSFENLQIADLHSGKLVKGFTVYDVDSVPGIPYARERPTNENSVIQDLKSWRRSERSGEASSVDLVIFGHLKVRSGEDTFEITLSVVDVSSKEPKLLFFPSAGRTDTSRIFADVYGGINDLQKYINLLATKVEQRFPRIKAEVRIERPETDSPRG